MTAPALGGVDLPRAGRGDTVRVREAGRDVVFTVDRIDRFTTGAEEWFRLTGLTGGRRVYLEWEFDRGLQAYLYDGTEVDIGSFGLDEERLAQLDDEQSRENHVEGDGRRWRYEMSREVFYHEGGCDDGEGFYAWEFISEDGAVCLGIEKWEGAPFAAVLCRKLRPGEMEVKRAV